MSRNDWLDTELLPLAAAPRPQMLVPRNGRHSLREIVRTGIHDRKRIALAFLLPFLATLLLASLVATRYTSEATLLLRFGHEYLYKPEVGDAAAAAPIAYDREQTLHAEVEILKSREVKEAVLAKLGADAIYPALARSQPDAARRGRAALLQLQKNFDAVLLKDSNVVRMTFTHPVARTAAEVLDAMIEAYLQRRRAIFDNGSTNAARADVVALRSRLNDAEGRLEGLKRARNIQSFAEQQSLLLAQSQSVEMRLADNAFALAQARGRSAALKSSLAATPASIQLADETQRSQAVDGARKRLLDLQLRERDLSARFDASVPVVQDVRNDIERTIAFTQGLEAHPDRTVRTGRNPVRDALEAEYARASADQRQASSSRSTLLAQREAIDGRLTDLGSSQRALEELGRERRMLESAFEVANKRLEDALVLDRLDRSAASNVKIMQPAREPLEAQNVRSVVIAVGLLLSVAIALLTALVSALWRDTYLSPDDLQRSLGLPLLAAVPRVALT